MRIERDFKSSNEPEQGKAKAFTKVHSAAALAPAGTANQAQRECACAPAKMSKHSKS